MRSKFLLVLAIILGGVTTFLFYNYMTTLNSTKANEQAFKMVDVVVAKENIKKNQLISKAMLQLVKRPEDGQHPEQVHSIQKAVGLFATTDLAKGELLLSHHLKSQRDEASFVSRKINQNKRAVSIGVNFVQSVSNLIEPEDHVDVLVTEKKLSGKQSDMVTQKILDNVRVLAVGMQMLPKPQASQSNNQSQSGQTAKYTSVTLELTTTDSIKLVNASQKGTIQLILHSSLVASK